jgi:hypothetical protein
VQVCEVPNSPSDGIGPMVQDGNLSPSEHYKFFASISHEGHTVKDIPCEIKLPMKLTDLLELIFTPNRQQSFESRRFFEFSVYGEVKDVTGKIITIIKADKVYRKSGVNKQWASITDYTFVGEPVDLRVIRLINGHKKAKGSKRSESTTVLYWVTPNILLRSIETLEPSFTGDVRAIRIRNFEFDLANRIHLKFLNRYKHYDMPSGEMVSFPELVAETQLILPRGQTLPSFQEIDDFLLLASFSARQRTVCLGCETWSSSRRIRFFRREITVPQPKKDHTIDDALIDIQDFENFSLVAYENFVKTGEKELLRQALFNTLASGTFEGTFLRLYSSLEGLLLIYRKLNSMEYVIKSDVEWKALCRDLQKFLRNHPYLADKKDKRKMIYEKIAELNRVSFSTALSQFSKHYNIDLQDLWPITDEKEGISLTRIRNHLAHGEAFSPKQFNFLLAAHESLRWIVERSLLRILGWPISDSRVSQSFLSRHSAIYAEWKNDRKELSV